MPEDNYGNQYSYTSSGKNSQASRKGSNKQRHSNMRLQGNHYCSRDFGSGAPNQNSYHYSNQNGSYYYSNPNGSIYYNSGKGESVYTNPSQSSHGSSQGSSQSSGQSSK